MFIFEARVTGLLFFIYKRSKVKITRGEKRNETTRISCNEWTFISLRYNQKAGLR